MTRTDLSRRTVLGSSAVVAAAATTGAVTAATGTAHAAAGPDRDRGWRPNIVFVMTDDHAQNAVSAYGSRLLDTPNIDRIGREGVRFTNSFCTNSICAPARATLLTGTYSHVNGIRANETSFDATQTSFPPLLQDAGYQTALFGKWHLGHGGLSDPHGFDEWAVLPGQGAYRNPELIHSSGERVIHPGYVSDVIADLSLDWLDRRDPDQPFLLMVHQKAPHRPWQTESRYADEFDGVAFPEPATLRDDYAGRPAAGAARMRVGTHLTATDLKEPVPDGLTDDEVLVWKYRRYLEDYLGCVRSVDENVGRVLDYLDEHDLTEDTIVIYTSDQGFYLGEHGWFDKRFMYEESLRSPLLMRLPRRMRGRRGEVHEMVLGLDLAETFLDAAGVEVPDRMQGRSLLPLVSREHHRHGRGPRWRDSIYYRYWMHADGSHGVWAHYGVRTRRYKLIYFYNDGLGVPGTGTATHEPFWELYDLRHDPNELENLADDPRYAKVRRELELELTRLQEEYADEPYTLPEPPPDLAEYGPVQQPYATYASTNADFHQDGERFAIVAGGADMWTGRDEYGAIYLAGAAGTAATVTTTVTHQENSDARAKAGLIVRNSIAAQGESTGYVAVAATPGNGFVMNWDANGDGNLDSAVSAGVVEYPCRLRLERSGSTYTGAYSTDGETWTTIHTVDVSGAADTQDVGLVATAHSATETTRADFDGLVVG